MIVTLSDGNPTPQWEVALLLDYSVKYWRLLRQPAPLVWSRISTDTQGPFQIADGGRAATLIEKVDFSTRRSLLTLALPPLSAHDTTRSAGSGSFVDPRDAGLKGGKLAWSVGQTGAGTGNSIRDDAIEMIERNLPAQPGTYWDPPNWVEKKDHGANTETNALGYRKTGCGGLPGKMFEELKARGWPIPNDTVDATNPRFTGRPRKPGEKPEFMDLTGRSTGYKQIVQEGVEKRLGTPGRIYVRFKRGDTRRPLPGDVYVIDIKGTGMFRHVGVVVDASTDTWITADGGQNGPMKSGFAVGLTRRSFDPRTGLIGGAGERGDLDGWIDIEALVRA